MILGIWRDLNNTIKKKIDLFFLQDEILGQKTVIYLTKHTKKIYHYLTNIQYTIAIHVHIVKMIIH